MLMIVVVCVLGASLAVLGFMLYNRMTRRWCLSDADMTGKTVIITGANSGVGYETALDLAGRNAKVILACRNLDNANKTRDLIQKATGNKQVVGMELDLCRLKSVRKFAADIIDQETRLDVLINNAGVVLMKHILTEDGLDAMWSSNLFGHFLLTNLLLDLLKKSTPSRVINLSSIAYRFGCIKFDPSTPTGLCVTRGGAMYNDSKLGNVLFTRELSQRLQGTGVTANSLHPGNINTGLFRHMQAPIRWFFENVASFFLVTPIEGAQTSIYLAVAPELSTVTGRYFSNCSQVTESARAQDDAVAKQLWELCETVTGLAES